MSVSAKAFKSNFPWFTIGLVGIVLVSLALRFWGLGRFNTLVFDEVYYAKFATAFLRGEQAFGGHPPLTNYLIAIAIWIGTHTPIGDSPLKNSLTEMLLAPASYRWLNALVGSFLPLVVAGIAYQLSHRRSYALIAALFMAADGLFLVESRYALNNIYLVLFGLLGHWFLLLAAETPSHRRWGWLLMSGIGFGASIAIKWNGLSFLLGAYLIWVAVWVLLIIQKLQNPASGASHRTSLISLHQLTQLSVAQVAIALAMVPALTYYLSWIPYMQLDPSTSFLQWQAQIVDYHSRVGGMDAHPYCSAWYSWIFMVRPVAYFYKTGHGWQEPATIIGPPNPQVSDQVIYDVHAIGNPALWWLAAIAMLLLLGLLLYQGGSWLKQVITTSTPPSYPTATPTYALITLYLGLSWSANLLPWLEIKRCTFLYHYMGASVFTYLALALVCDRWLYSSDDWRRVAALTAILLILLALVFWMPIYLGLPLSPDGFRLRMWLPTWV